MQHLSLRQLDLQVYSLEELEGKSGNDGAQQTLHSQCSYFKHMATSVCTCRAALPDWDGEAGCCSIGDQLSNIEYHDLQVQRLEGLEGEVANLEATLQELAGDLEASGRAQVAMQRRLTAAEGELARARRMGGSAAVGDCTAWSAAACRCCCAVVQSSHLTPPSQC